MVCVTCLPTIYSVHIIFGGLEGMVAIIILFQLEHRVLVTFINEKNTKFFLKVTVLLYISTSEDWVTIQ